VSPDPERRPEEVFSAAHDLRPLEGAALLGRTCVGEPELRPPSGCAASGARLASVTIATRPLNSPNCRGVILGEGNPVQMTQECLKAPGDRRVTGLAGTEVWM